VFVVLIIQHAKRMRRTLLSSVAYLTLQLFSPYLINARVCEKENVNEHKICV